MANVRFFRLSNLPDYNPTYRGVFVYVTEGYEASGNGPIAGYNVVVPVTSASFTANGTIGTSNVHIQTVWGNSLVPAWTTSHKVPVDGIDFEAFYDETNGGYIVAGQPNYITTDEDSDGNVEITQGLWFGGDNGWELLTNVPCKEGITWSQIYNWFDNNVAGEAEIFSSSATQSGTGVEYTIFDPVLDRTNGLHASSDSSDTHTFTIGDGALKLTGFNFDGTQLNEPIEIHSANDTADNTVVFDEGFVVAKIGNTDNPPHQAKISIRTNTAVSTTNLVATMADIASLSGAMHLIGTLNATDDWPDQSNSIWYTGNGGASATGHQTTQIHEGDVFIVTTTHTGPDNVRYEVGDTVFYYSNGTSLVYKVVNQNITDGVSDGQYAHNDGNLTNGKIVVATTNGIATSNIAPDDLLTGTPTRSLTLTSGTADTVSLIHSVAAADAITIGSTTVTSTLNVSTPNKSIAFTTNDTTDTITVDLVWRETLNYID